MQDGRHPAPMLGPTRLLICPSSSQAPKPCEWAPGLGWRSHRVATPGGRPAGLPAMHFHDLRHTGNGLTANAGANLRELMTRIGHTSARAALVYLHSTDERQREIAAGLEQLVRARMTADKISPEQRPRPPGTGTQRARGTTVAGD